MRPHAAHVHDGAALAIGDHAPDDGLGQEESRPVEVVIGVVVRDLVVEEGLGLEESRGVDEKRGVGVVLRQLLLCLDDLVLVGQIGCDGPGAAGARQCCLCIIQLLARAADDHRAAASGDHVLGGLEAHTAGAADHDEFPAFEVRGHGNHTPLNADRTLLALDVTLPLQALQQLYKASTTPTAPGRCDVLLPSGDGSRAGADGVPAGNRNAVERVHHGCHQAIAEVWSAVRTAVL